MKKNILPAIVLALVLSASCQENKPVENVAQASVSQKDKKMTAEKFTKKAFIGNKAEVQLGELAQKKASSSKVKEFGQMMIDDHGQANEELTALAESQNIQLPDTLSSEIKKNMQSLKNKSGKQFDQAYMEMMVKDHKKDVEFYQQACAELENTELKNYATSTLPTLQKHLKRAQEINQTMQGAEAKKQ